MPVVLFLISIKKLLKVKGLDILANILLNLYKQYELATCVFNITEHRLFLYDVLNVKKHICHSVSDHIDN